MSEQTVTLTLPPPIYAHLKYRAEATGRTVLGEIVDSLSAQMQLEALSPDSNQAIAALSFYSDDELWQAAKSRVPVEDSASIEQLQHKRGHEGLIAEEEQRLSGLLRFSDRIMLVRAQAAALLKERGRDVSVLFK